LRKHCEKRFLTDDELKSATEQWMIGQPQSFYFDGIENLRDRHKLCRGQGDDYVDK